MPLPAAYDLVTLTGRYVDILGNPLAGKTIRLSLAPDALVVVSADTIITPEVRVITLDVNGFFTVDVPASDDPDVNPNGWTYRVEEEFGARRSYNIEVTRPGPHDMSDLAPVAVSPGVGIVVGPPGRGIPDGGTAGQLLAKTDDATAWVTPSYASTQALSDGLATKVNSSTYTAGLAGKADATDTRFTDQRVPTDSSVTNAKVATNAAISADKLADGTTGKVLTAAERTKLAGIATGATVNSTDATLLARANHTGTQSADTIVDGTTNHTFTAADDTKLAGIAAGATVNATDAQLRDRTTHTGFLPTTAVSGTAGAGKYWDGGTGTWTTLPTGGLTAAQIAADATVQAAMQNAVPVTRFGVATTNTAAQNDTAFAAAIASGLPLWLPAGTYDIDTTINLYDSPCFTFVGAGPITSVLRMSSAKSIVRIGGEGKYLSGVGVFFASPQPNTATAAVALEIRGLYRSVIDRVEVRNAAYGMDMPALASNGVSSNYIFSNTISNMRFQRCSIRSIRLNSWQAGSTGNVFSNIYTEGWTDFGAGLKQTVGQVIEMSVHDATILTNINVEWVTVSNGHAISLVECRNIVANALHYEGVDLTTWGSSLCSIFSSSDTVTITGMDVVTTKFLDGELSVFNLDAGVDVQVRGLHVRETTKTTPNAVGLVRGSATARIEITGYENFSPGTIADTLVTGNLPPLKRLNDNWIHRIEGGKNITWGTAAPTADTWAVGDKRWNTAVTAGGPLGWVCTTAGTPGTWQAFGGGMIVQITQAAYDALGTKDANTFYAIVG